MLQTEVGGRKLKIKKKEESEGEIRRKEVEKKEGGRKWGRNDSRRYNTEGMLKRIGV